jgi:hypothetical protein
MSDNTRSAGHAAEHAELEWRRLTITAGLAGLISVVLLFAGAIILAVGGEPGFTAKTDEIVGFFQSRNPGQIFLTPLLTVLGLIGFVWFIAAIAAVCRRLEPTIQWRSQIVFGSGLVGVAAGLNGSWEAVLFRVSEGLDPEVARFAFDLGNVVFASSWVAFGSFALASGWVLLSGTAGWRRHGWWAIVAGAGLIASRAFWTSPAWFFPYALFWLWVIAVSIRMLRRSTRHIVREMAS